jgi:hypothetical protein
VERAFPRLMAGKFSDVGASPEILITQQFGRRTSLSVSYYHFYRGGFLTENQPNLKDVDYFPTWLTYTF